jgi:glutamyl-tRNA synthetase
MSDEIRVRIPPSPTGNLHIGTARTALFNWLFARANGGKIIFRFEDTDRDRSEKKFEENILSGLQKLGIDFDEGPFWQSQRGEIYREFCEKLIAEKKAYFCFCSAEKLEKIRAEQISAKLPPRHDCDCREKFDEKTAREKIKNGENFTIRFAVPKNREIIFHDLIRGEIKFSTNEISDFIIAKNFEHFLYNFCVVCDDAEMRISHILRGEDGISNTPKQILIFESLNFPIPKFGHFPLILNSARAKLSKRDGATSVDDFLKMGFLPDAILNFLALLGFHPKNDKEIFDREFLLREFSLKKVHKAGAIFDQKKLEFLNNFYLKNLPREKLVEVCAPFFEKYFMNNGLQPVAPTAAAICAVREKAKTLAEIPQFAKFFFVAPKWNFDDRASELTPDLSRGLTEENEIPRELFANEKMGVDFAGAKFALEFAAEILREIYFPVNGRLKTAVQKEDLQKIFVEKIAAAGKKNGEILWPVRVALSGEKFSPGVFEICEVLGATESLRRIETARAKL